MAGGKYADRLADYVDVDERMRWFFEKYPEGSLQSLIVQMTDTFVIVQGFAYRTPDDPIPGQGLAYEPIPGTTPYTRNSEVMNAETSAWGRALAAVGAPTRGHVASAAEVRGRWSEQPTPWTDDAPKGNADEGTHQHEWEPVPDRALERCKCGATRKTQPSST